MSSATPTARQRLTAFRATNPLPEQTRTPDALALAADADFERQVELHTDPVAMRVEADALDAEALRHDRDAAADERSAGVRLDHDNDHAAREFADRAVGHRRAADKARRLANVLRASAARLIERVAA